MPTHTPAILPIEGLLAFLCAQCQVASGVFWGNCWSALCHCDHIPDMNTLEEEVYFLASGFRGFCPWVAGSTVLDLR